MKTQKLGDVDLHKVNLTKREYKKLLKEYSAQHVEKYQSPIGDILKLFRGKESDFYFPVIDSDFAIADIEHFRKTVFVIQRKHTGTYFFDTKTKKSIEVISFFHKKDCTFKDFKKGIILMTKKSYYGDTSAFINLKTMQISDTFQEYEKLENGKFVLTNYDLYCSYKTILDLRRMRESGRHRGDKVKYLGKSIYYVTESERGAGVIINFRSLKSTKTGIGINYKKINNGLITMVESHGRFFVNTKTMKKSSSFAETNHFEFLRENILYVCTDHGKYILNTKTMENSGSFQEYVALEEENVLLIGWHGDGCFLNLRNFKKVEPLPFVEWKMDGSYVILKSQYDTYARYNPKTMKLSSWK